MRFNEHARKYQKTKSKVKTSSRLLFDIKHLISNCTRHIKDPEIFFFPYSHMQHQGMALV